MSRHEPTGGAWCANLSVLMNSKNTKRSGSLARHRSRCVGREAGGSPTGAADELAAVSGLDRKASGRWGEAGPCGYGLHRHFSSLGVINYVVALQRWDGRGGRVKTDKRDARELVYCRASRTEKNHKHPIGF